MWRTIKKGVNSLFVGVSNKATKHHSFIKKHSYPQRGVGGGVKKPLTLVVD